MKTRSALLAFATAAALLAVAPGRATADPNNASGTWELHVEVPNVAMASNGDTLAITGMGVFSTHPKTVTASGTFTHDVAPGGTATGTWTATDLLSIQFYGCGVVPSIGVTTPPDSCGGALKMRVVLTPAGTSLTIPGIITVFCVIGPQAPCDRIAERGRENHDRAVFDARPGAPDGRRPAHLGRAGSR